jgi:hypothetical protein
MSATSVLKERPLIFVYAPSPGDPFVDRLREIRGLASEHDFCDSARQRSRLPRTSTSRGFVHGRITDLYVTTVRKPRVQACVPKDEYIEIGAIANQKGEAAVRVIERGI